ncbi:hypothetical protein Esi_0050_0105 [Ectocarpus siliculosus]|uniref:Uncharacterized protein n=1 Tax=Ectocarpus siliculosus TaxID=2880 RepID=D7G399_ECTSI|nr:hypothetical protein Esi_0050_0105 [Ectocarpus siliculosus]|eukprot:CBJ26946.1 hypothetical protein Esi_0050_0105 [Ectocarpus siliculosus]
MNIVHLAVPGIASSGARHLSPLEIVVDPATLYRYERTTEGALLAFDKMTIEQGAASASSATADVTGDWVVYLARSANEGLAYINAAANPSTGLFSLGSTFTIQTGWDVEFIAAHPDGTRLYDFIQRLYAGRTSNGKVVGNASLVAYRTHTETPSTLSPTQAPTPAPTATPDPTPSPTVSRLGNSNEISPPELISAELSETESLFALSFNRTCYCTAGAGVAELSELSFPPALCGHDFVTGVYDQRFVV